MIMYTDGSYIATFDERGSLTEFQAVSFYGVPEGTIGGKQGKRMIEHLRTPQLRRTIRDEPGIKITVPV